MCSQVDHTETESSCRGQVFLRAILAQSAQHVYRHGIPPLISLGNIGDVLRLLVCSQLDHIETESSCRGKVFPRAILAQSARLLPLYSTVDISRQLWRCPEAPGVQSA